MFAKNKVSQSMIDAVNSVINESKVDEASEKVTTSTGMKVYGSNYGNSAKAHRDQTKSAIDNLKGPKTKELKVMDKEPKRNFDEELKGNQSKIDANHNNKIDAQDFKILRAKKKVSEESEKEEGHEDAKQDKAMIKKMINKSEHEDEKQDKTMIKKIADKEADKKVKGHENRMHKSHVKENIFYNFAKQLQEDKSKGTEPTFTDNNIGEEDDSEALEKQIKDNVTKSMKAMGKNDRQIKYVHKKTDDVIKKAAGEKVKKEEVELDEEELDEISKTLAANYRHKAGQQAINAYIDNKPTSFLGINIPVSKKTAEKNSALIGKRGKGMSAAADRVSGAKPTSEEVELDEATPKKNQDIADKAYLKHKPGTVKGQLTQIGLFLRGKPEIKESVQTQVTKTGDKITTDMLTGREKGGKLNSFKSYKVDLTTSGDEAVPKDFDSGEDTREKQKITTNPGPVNIKFDDKLGQPSVQSHFSTQNQITSEEVRGELKVLRNKAKDEHNKDINIFNKKEIKSVGENNWIAGAIKHPGALTKKAKSAGETNSEYEQQHKHDSGKTGKQARLALTLKSLNKEEIGSVEEKVIAGMSGFKKIQGADEKGNVTDKSGAIHTPMSRAKNVAKLTFKKLKQEMLGKIAN